MTTSARPWLIAMAFLLVLWPVGPATAHEGEGTLTILSAEPAASLEVAYRVRLTFTADGHPAADATVTAVAQDPAGTTTTPQPLGPTAEEGVYAGTLRFPAPGSWTVRFTAVSPAATLERPEAVAPPSTTTSTTTAPTTTATTLASRANGDLADDRDSVPLVPAVAAGAVLAASAALWFRRRRR